MRIAYDKESRGLLIRFRDGAYSESEEIVPGVVVDFDGKGRAIGLELEDVRGLVDEPALEHALRPQVHTGADLREFRDSWGLTQQQLARGLGIPTNTIARWERSEVRIEKPLMLTLALRGLFASPGRSAKKGTRSYDRTLPRNPRTTATPAADALPAPRKSARSRARAKSK